MKIIFYIPDNAKNDATLYYVELVKKAFDKLDLDVEEFTNTNFKYDTDDYFFTIRTRDFVKIFLKTFSFKIIHWYQGIGPEEYLLINNGSLKAKFISFLFTIIEFFVFRIAFLNFYVSESMREFLEKKYKKRKKNYGIVPCYNKELNEIYFSEQVKIKNSFVYAGSLFGWQCYEQTIKLYSEIENKIEDSSLTILTKDLVEAEQMVKKYKLKDCKIYYVTLNDLDKELSKFQFGFLLRENININNVSTPTKMNSYLSSGIIPIYSDVIHAFKSNIDLGEFNMSLDKLENFDFLIQKIIDIEIDYEKFYEVCKIIFDKYYNDEINVCLIKEAFEGTYENK